MLIALGFLAAFLYVGAAAAITTRLFHSDGPMHTPAKVSIVVAWLIHLFVLYNQVALADGQNLSILNVISLVAWIITGVITLLAFKQQQSFLLPMVAGFSALVMIANSVIPDTAIMHIELQPFLLIHIGLALFAYGSLCIALLYALQLAFINNRLKHKSSFILHSSLPPLMEVEHNLFKLLLFGTVLLTLSLVTGFIFLDDMFAQRQVHKTILACLAWVVFVGTLVAHARLGSRGKSVIIATIVGMLLLTLAYFGSRFVKEVLLS